ncbi:hypothetical protein V495_04130 [Pseudogymnoascus sp. VKM F-4514 (FW-929)]|nr:hypothetical protein V495_04130 [Pseudogymnoascus sp. VKM F-4514 (FW-929)]KFY55391.1 hypothetical protein V497_07005 [Pseudogymnoascus sp. VKM F-4516 (FW-969)]
MADKKDDKKDGRKDSKKDNDQDSKKDSKKDGKKDDKKDNKKDRKNDDKKDDKKDSKGKIEFSPAIPTPFILDVPARIKALQGYLDPNNPSYQPERQHINIRAVIKLYEEGKINGLERTTVIDGKVAPYEETFTSKTGSWTEVSVVPSGVRGFVG